MEEPLRQIVQNAGLEGSIVVNKVREGKDDFGYNAQTDEYGNLLKMGVIDPVKVVRTALQNAASVASLMLTTECLVAERPKEEKPAAGGGQIGDTASGCLQLIGANISLSGGSQAMSECTLLNGSGKVALIQ